MTEILAPDARKSSEREKKPHTSHVCRTPAPVAAGAAAGREVRTLRSKRGVAPLGIDAKYNYQTPKPQRIDPATGEILGIVDPMASRIQRFMLQSVARKLLPKTRTNNCLRVRQGGKQIQVLKSKEHGTASYGGLQTCGSVWQCPVCAAKISERRRVEVLGAMTAHKAQGGAVNMLTLTCPHQRSDDLVELLAKQAKALTRFWSDKQVKALLAELLTIGQIKATEVTHGRLSTFDNGWHPHYHVLLFCGSGVDLEAVEAALYPRWVNACRLAGLGEPSREHGLKLDGGDEAGKYISKWGLENEITKGHIKKAKTGETPFDLLRALALDDSDRQAAALFIEFANAFKGKRQLRWSKGLKARFALEEKSDEALAEEKDDHAELLGLLTIEQWRDVLAADGRGTLLSAACRGGWPLVLNYLAQIEGFGVKPSKPLPD
jgi:hypothetical protein